jgi:conjugal transfer/type IV secretion protein DotA/TraY
VTSLQTRTFLIAAAVAVVSLLLPELAHAAATSAIRGRDIIQDIFGIDASTLATAIATANQNDKAILAKVSGVINAAALTVTVIVMVLTLFNGAIATARTGKVFGQRYDAVWVPLRMVIGLGMLTPMASGYSLIQVLILWLGMVGSSMADEGWLFANAFMRDNMTFTTVATAPKTRETVVALYQSEVCAARLEQVANESHAVYGITRPTSQEVVERPVYGGGLFGAGFGVIATDVTHAMVYAGTGELQSEGPLCGGLTVSTAVGADGADLNVRWFVANLHALRAQVEGIARDVVNGAITAGKARAALTQVEAQYAQNEHLRKRRFIAMTHGPLERTRRAQIDRGRDAGWIAAGAFYMTFTGTVSAVQAQANLDHVTLPPQLGKLPESLRADVEPYLAAAGGVYGTGVSTDVPTGLPEEDQGSESWLGGLADLAESVAANGFKWAAVEKLVAYLGGWLSELFIGMHKGLFLSSISGERAVMAVIVDTGHYLLTSLWTLLAVVLKIGFATAGIGALVLGFLALPFIVPLGLAGITLAYIIPAIPFLIWTMGVLGWMLILVLGVVAGPLWAAAHVNPDGDGWAGDRARAGYMILLSLIARPVMMVVGLVAGMVVLEVAGKVMMVTFGWMIDSVTTGYTFGLLGFATMSLMTFALLLTIARWSFSLIHVVPDRALKAIGGPEEGLGEERGSDRAQGMLNAALGYLVGRGGGRGGGGNERGKATKVAARGA